MYCSGALYLLAVMAHAQKRLGPALELVRKAVAAAPGAAGYHNTMGVILGDLRQWGECLAAFGNCEGDTRTLLGHSCLSSTT
jgi:hypothetical protein